MKQSKKDIIKGSVSEMPASIFVNRRSNFPYNLNAPTSDAYTSNLGDTLSNQTKEILSNIDKLNIGARPSYYIQTSNEDSTLEEGLFDAKAKAKILISRVSMYIDKDWRERLFHQIDNLHDIENWEDDDKPVIAESFQTFLRWYLIAKPENPPGFGLSYTGNLVAAWVVGDDKLILEFSPNDYIKWMISKHYEDEIERATGVVKSSRLSNALMPYEPQIWLNHE